MSTVFQCLAYCLQSEGVSLLIGATGPSIHTFDLRNGRHLHTWPVTQRHSDPATLDQSQVADAQLNLTIDDNDTPPAKRPKLTSEVSASSSTEIITEQPGHIPEQAPSIVRLRISRDAKHLIAITGEDKCIRVYDILPSGELRAYSERIMPKRPSALDITHDNQTILSADKFGDVYALPLLGKAFEVQTEDSASALNAADGETETKGDAFVSKANTFTVHTKRNRNVLLQQQNLKAKKPVKKDISFDHELILGHVSLLTDLICISFPTHNKSMREYILTCDRDEHIRVSRGHPQAHIIENFCLGHASFVSKLCVVPNKPEMLISGGGDDEILVWNWTTGQIQQRINLKDIAESCNRTNPKENTNAMTIAVNNVVFVPAHEHVSDAICVSIERMPFIFRYTLDADYRLDYAGSIHASGSILDMIVIDSTSTILYSTFGDKCSLDIYDTAHEDPAAAASGDKFLRNAVGNINSKFESITRATPTSLYTLENLRKQGNDEEP